MSSDITLRLEKGTDLSYLEGDENFTHIRRLYRFTEDSVTSSGAGNSYTIVSTAEPVTSFVDNLMIGFIANHANNAVDPDVTVDGLVAKTIKNVDGSTLEPDVLLQNAFYIIRYNAGTDNFWLLNSTEIAGLAARVTANENAISSIESDVQDNADELADIRTTQGRPAGAVNLGTFTGNTIPNNTSVKTALQSLETLSEANEAAIDAIFDGFVFNPDSTNGSFVIPYSDTNGFLINWGSRTVGGDSFVTENLDTAYTSAYQAVVSYRANTTGIGDAPSYILTNSQIQLYNSWPTTTIISYITIGRLAL